MKTNIFHAITWAAVAGLAALTVGAQTSLDPSPAPKQSAPIPMDQLGAMATKQYRGDGLSVSATPDGARLRCAFQRLEGEVTRDGLWLRSTVGDTKGERFQVLAVAVGRETEASATPTFLENFTHGGWGFDPDPAPLEGTGSVTVTGPMVRFIRRGMTEEYSVSVDGVRQDFIVEQRPEGEGALRVELAVTGAKAEVLANGARLVLGGSGRKLAYNRLQVVDAEGKELPARLEVQDSTRLAVVVDDATAVYPVRIDPTFSDADWISMGVQPGANGPVYTMTVDGSGNLFIGGSFTVVDGVAANYVAQWNGNAWSALGSGLNNYVYALVVSGSDLYVGGSFLIAGGNIVHSVARWDGSVWSALGSGVAGSVNALVVSANDLYVGGGFTTAGGNSAGNVAKWDGSAWSALGTGLNNTVNALTLLGGDLYAGGAFTRVGPGGIFVNYVAKWNGSAWSALGSGTGGSVRALALSGSDLYVGGQFTTAGDGNENNLAKWNGNAWSAVGPGLNTQVRALTVSGSDLYVGGGFTTAGGVGVNRVAKWNGSAWSALGSGMGNNYVYALGRR